MEPFGVVLIVVCLLAIAAGAVSLIGRGDLYRDIGKGGLSLDTPDRVAGPPPGSAAADAEAEAEIRQMVEAKSARRVAAGEPAIDVDAEVARLLAPSDAGPAESGGDAGLREEVREMVLASNERRLRKGLEPLAVEAEVERRLREYGGG